PELQGGIARQGRRSPVPGGPATLPELRRKGHRQAPPGGVGGDPGKSASASGPITARPNPSHGQPGQGRRREGGGAPEEDGAERGPLRPTRGARLREPARAGRCYPEQRGESRRRRGRQGGPRERRG